MHSYRRPRVVIAVLVAALPSVILAQSQLKRQPRTPSTTPAPLPPSSFSPAQPGGTGAPPAAAPLPNAGGAFMDPAPVAAAPKTGGFEQNPFAQVPFKNPRDVLYAGIQFGPEKRHTVYLALDHRGRTIPQKSGDPIIEYDTLYVCAPEDPKMAEPKALKGMTGKNEVMTFKGIEVSAPIEGGAISFLCPLEYGLRSQMFSGAPEITVAKGKDMVRFRVDMSKVRASSSEGAIGVSRLYGKPEMRMRLMDGGRKVAASLEMGTTRILPLAGIEKDATLEIVDDTGKPVEKKKMGGNAAQFPEKETWESSTGRLPLDKTFNFKVSINLGPLGIAAAEQSQTISKRVKL